MAARRVMRMRAGLLLMAAGAAWAMPPEEEIKSRALIAKVESAGGAVFIRNGTEYKSANAAEFLRRKCARDWGGMASAREFIARCASASSTSGKPYLIRLEGREAQPSGVVLTRWLEEIEHGK
jgi:hypothetical protein